MSAISPPAPALQAIAAARSGVIVGVVNAAKHLEVAVENGRGLQVIGRDALPAHLQNIVGDFAEAARLQRAYHRQEIGIAGHEGIGRFQVGHDVALGHVIAAVGLRGGPNFFIRDRRQLQFAVDRLYRAGGFAADRQRRVFADRAHAAVNLHIALQDVVIIEVFGIKVAAAEEVVALGDGAVAAEDEVGAGDELQHQLGRFADARVRGQRIVAGRHFQAQHGRQQVLRQHRAHAARQRLRQGDARYRAVLHALAAGAFHHQQAARLKVKHRLPLGAAHQRFRARARGEADFHAARGIG